MLNGYDSRYHAFLHLKKSFQFNYILQNYSLGNTRDSQSVIWKSRSLYLRHTSAFPQWS